jgi:HPt (histidine-containing phosphotransfer) domain-containing protein
LDDQDILDLLPGFLESCQQSIQELPRLLSERAWAAIAITGHNIKGTATSFGCGMLGDIAGQLERAAHSHDVVETEGRVGDLQTCLQHWISELPLP